MRSFHSELLAGTRTRLGGQGRAISFNSRSRGDQTRRLGYGLLFGTLATTLALLPSEAAAFCLLRTCQDPADFGCEQDGNPCDAPGKPLYYESPCLAYGVQQDSGSAFDLRDEDFDAIVQAAFARWQNVDCGEGITPSLTVTSVGPVDVAKSFFCDKDVNQNLSVWSFVDTWKGHDPESVGFTSNQFTYDTGQVFDADVELNSERLTELLQGSDWIDALTNVATHEAGHVLGLGHSTDFASIMAYTYAEGFGLSVRTLTDDDITAICALYPPSTKRLHCVAPSYSKAALDAKACAAANPPVEVDTSTPEPARTKGCSLIVTAPLRAGFPALCIAALATMVLLLRRSKRAHNA